MGRMVDFPLIFERSVPGRRGVRPPVCDVPTQPLEELLGEHLRPEPPALPEVSELDALRHYTRLSRRNYGSMSASTRSTPAHGTHSKSRRRAAAGVLNP